MAPTLPTCPYMYVVPLTAGNRFLYGDARSLVEREAFFVLSCPFSSFTLRKYPSNACSSQLLACTWSMYIQYLEVPPLPPIVRPLNYPPIDCARIYSICNTTGVCGTAGADLQLHPMDGCITDRPTERPTDRPTERQIPHHHSLSRLSCCHWGKSTSTHLIVQRASNRFPQKLIQTAGRGEHVQVQVACCRCRTAGRRARGVVERRACIPGVSLSLGPRTPFPVQSLLPPTS